MAAHLRVNNFPVVILATKLKQWEEEIRFSHCDVVDPFFMIKEDITSRRDLFKTLHELLRMLRSFHNSGNSLRSFRTFILPSILPFSLERDNFSDIGDASREFSRDLGSGSSFPFSLLRSQKSSPGKYYTTISVCFCYFNVYARRYGKLYVSRRITFAHSLARQVPAGLQK